MSLISTLFVAKIIAQAPKTLDPDGLFRRVGLDPAEPVDAKTMIEADRYYDLLETIARAEGPNPRFHLCASTTMRCADFGPVGLALKSAPTLRQSFQQIGHYTQAFTRASNFDFVERGGAVWLAHDRPGAQRRGLLLSNEAALATFVTLCREAAGPGFSPAAVHMRHDPAGSVHALGAMFRCQMEFGSQYEGIGFLPAMLDRPNTIGDDGIWRYLSEQLEQMFPAAAGRDQLHRDVSVQIAELLTDGVPTLDDVARNLGIGSRTLQRRLAAQGRSFQSLIDETRRAMAERLVASTDFPLAEIALRTGFSEQSSFSRAFKRWAGQSPRAYRSARI